LTTDEEEKINKDLENKMIKNDYISKKDFMEYNFWFENFFEYNFKDEDVDWIIDEYKDNKMNIKDLLFELWKDDKGININIKQLLLILRMGKYITDLSNNNNKKYFDIIFN
jgi:hypothetical protein